MNPLVEFLEGSERNKWLRYPHMEVYVRKGHHKIGKGIAECIDIANINVDEDYRHKGLFTDFLDKVEELAIKNMMFVYIENILNDRFRHFILLRGYKVAETLNCYWRFPSLY